MSVKSKLLYSLKQVLKHDNQGSYATRYDRATLLRIFSRDIVTLGYKIPHIADLRMKHVRAAVAHWQQRGLSNASIKNRMSAVRHLFTLIQKPTLVPSNADLGIGARQYIPPTNKALYDSDFSRITNARIRVSVELQRVFGLRREESLKIKPHLADKNTVLELLPSWCKGGRGRFVPIRNEEQRYWLNRAKEIVISPENSLIPEDKTYIQQRYIYDKQVFRAGLGKLHGLRHAYAQTRYEEITGWKPPIKGGPKKSELTKEQKIIDRKARQILTEELGHSRIQITNNYLGR